MKKVLAILLSGTMFIACNGGDNPTPIHDSGTVIEKLPPRSGSYYLYLHNDRAGYWEERTTKYVYDRCDKGDHWNSDTGC